MKKKNKKLAVQVSVIVTAIFTVSLFLIGSIVLQGTKRMYFQSNNEKIEKEMEECKSLLMNPEIAGWVLDQWQSEPNMMREPVTELEQEIFDSFVFSRFVAELDSIEDMENMDSEMRRAYLKALYRFLAAWVDGKRADGRFDSFFLLDIRGEDHLDARKKDGFFIIMECSEDTDETHDHCLGQYWEKEANYSFVNELFEKNHGDDKGEILYHEMIDDDEAMYVAVSPGIVNGEIRYVVCLEYDWSSFASILNQNTYSIALWGGVSLLVANLLVILFMYLKAVRPLVQVNNGIHEYMKDKDKDAAVKSMEIIREKNEVGRLADSIAAMAVEIDRSAQENLRLHGERERVAAELDLAARIQSDSLPQSFPARQDVELFASMDPAKEVGGDFYDFFFIDDQYLGLVIADVSGKGIPAALFMMMSKNLIKDYAMMGLSPAEVLNKTNASLCENNRNQMFVTVWFGILDLATGRVTAANGGHEYPMLRKAGGNFELFKEKHGMVLGALKKKTYTEYTFDIEPGGTLFVYTDGAPEATDARNQLFGTDRMLEALNRDPDDAPEALLKNMKSAIDQFVGDAPQFDDLTMLSVKYLSKRQEETK